jgi:HK97 family phage prohead protease
MDAAARRAIREAQVRALNCRQLDLYLEHRHAYRQLVMAHAHRGVPVPEPPKYRTLPSLNTSSGPVAVGIEADTRPGRVLRRFRFASVEAGSGRTVEARIVPYLSVALVRDAGRPDPYREQWLMGAFEEQARTGRPAAFLNVEHEQGIRGVVGHTVELQEREDGLHGVFVLLKNQDGDKALELVRANVLSGLSLEAVVQSSRRTVDGIVQRLKARLEGAALTRRPAFADAKVLAVRDGE